MIKSYVEGNILEGLKRLDHVFFSLPTDGGKAALSLREEDRGGYSFLHQLVDEYQVPVSDAAEVDFAAENLGKLWDFHEEELDVQFHGVYNHSLQVGWHPAAYEIVTRKLDDWWEENEDSIVRPCRSLVLGDGLHLAKIAKDAGGFTWSRRPGTGVMANTEVEFACFWAPE